VTLADLRTAWSAHATFRSSADLPFWHSDA
jgi:hypothetical protein